MDNKFICAVGDSFVFGSELVTTYHGDEFKDVKNYHQLEFEVHPDDEQRKKYFDLLDQYRFTSLVAKDLGRDHINYAIGGSGQEGIKFQAYTLMKSLRENGIDPKNTTWIVGLTMDTRKFMPGDHHEHYYDMKLRYVKGDDNWVWSRTTSSTLFCDRVEQPLTVFTKEFVKESINATSATNISITWLMHILDTIHMLRDAKVEQIILVNFFHNKRQLTFNPGPEGDSILLRYCRTLADEYRQYILPSDTLCFNNLLSHLEKCTHGHPSKEGNRAIADYVVNRIRENETIFLYKEIDETGRPLSNNRLSDSGRCPSFTRELFENNRSEKITDNLPGSNYGFVVHFDYEEYYRENSLVEYFERRNIIPESIKDLIRQRRCRLFYDVVYEGHVEDKDFDQLYALNEYYGFPNEQFTYVTAALGAPDIHYSYCKIHTITNPIRIIAFPLFEIFIKDQLSYSKIHKKVEPIEKKFMCLNRSPRPQRLFLTTYILSKPNLLSNFYYSFTHHAEGYCFETATKHVHKGSRTVPILHEEIDLVGKMLPLNLDPHPAVTFDSYGSDIEYYYARSLFNLTTESHFFEGAQHGFSTAFLTEKCFKPFVYGQIPIILGPPMIIFKLRQLGYDVFDDIVDHSYDTVMNHSARFNALIREVHRLNDKYSLDNCNTLNSTLATRFQNNLMTAKAPFTSLQEWRHLNQINYGH